jgi:leucyl-tRNA synthetase
LKVLMNNMQRYNHKKIEAKWQKVWLTKKAFLAKDFSKKPKKYILVEFPYPSGAGLHMGHLRPYVAGDVYSRFQRMRGYEVVFPIGWDAFGLPAENYAIKMGVHPSITTAQNVKNAKKQMLSWGLSFDWSREVNTTDPNYYKWTQWLFLQFYKKGLAYEATGLINWCPKDKTGLANEEVIDGKCERCGTVVEKKELRQWYLKITAYAEKLLEGLKNLPEWPSAVKLQQENWIGKSVGAEIEFPLNEKFNYVFLQGFNGSNDKGMFPWLIEQLKSRGLGVWAENLPNADHPKEQEQVEFVLKNAPINKSTIIFGHSLGCAVALKVVEKLDHKIAGLVFAGGFISPNFKDHRRIFEKDFKWKFDFKKIKDAAGSIQLLYDNNDYAVSDDQAALLSTALNVPMKKITAVSAHFHGKEEPEVLQALIPSIKVFTTRPDTIFGATYMVVAPEHPIIENSKLKIENWEQVEEYIEKTKGKTEIDRSSEGKEKTGVELKGIKAINPATKEEIPVWVADYVLWGYGTGAIMAVPAHDERDFEFAKKFNLSIKKVISGQETTEAATVEYGKLINSGEFTGMSSQDAIPKMAAAFGKATTQFKLRDWVFSRQRYWGEPIPIIHCTKCGIVPVPEKDLPVILPKVLDYQPTGTGESPLAAIDKWVNVKCPVCKSSAKRETNTMPNWAGSSWYWLRYTDPKNKKSFADLKKQKYWTPVDVYFGGMEHTTLHLLYSRFWNLFLYDQGLVSSREPYLKRKPHGIILGPDGEKMSKSRGNVVNPQDIVASHGADTLRMFELFLGPHEDTIAWNDKSVVGVKRFLDRVWNWVSEKNQNPKFKIHDSEKAERALHKLIKKTTIDIEEFSFNTCISSFMEFHNEVKDEAMTVGSIKTFLKLLSPFAPHIAEELNQLLGSKKVLGQEAWPVYDEAKTVDNTVEIVVQINGKVKGKLTIATGTAQEAVLAQIKKIEGVSQALGASEIKRVIFVPNRLVNLVI